MQPRVVAAVVALILASIASAATSFDVVLPSNSTTGVSFNFTVTAKNGVTTDTTYTGTVHFTSSDPGAALPSDYTFTLGDAGSHTFSATMNSAGPDTSTRNQSITATDTGNASITGTGATTVKWAPNVVRMIVVDVPETVDRTVPFQGTVSAWNADFQVVPSYTGTVHFRATDGIVFPPDYTFTPADNGTHTFTFTANRGGSHVITSEDVSEPATGRSDSFTVNCPELTATASNTGPICGNGDSTILLGNSNQANVTYYWTGPHTWFSTEQNPSVTQPGQYFLEVSNADGCRTFATTTVELKAKESPQINASSANVCAGEHVTASIANAASFSNIVWDVEGGTLVSGQGTSSIDVATSGFGPATLEINVSATYTSSGCAVTGARNVAVKHKPNAQITTPTNACPNATLSASVAVQDGPTNFHWTVTHAEIVGDAGREIFYMPDGTGDAAVSVTLRDDISQCEASSSVTVSIDGPTATIVQNDLATCPSQGIDIPVVLSGSPPFSITWSDGVTQNGVMTSSVVRNVAPTETTTYAITGISDMNCSGNASGSALVQVEAEPAILDQPDNVAIARGATATLALSARGSDLTYSWYQGVAGDRSHPVFSGPPTFKTPPLSQTTMYWVEVESACGATSSRTAIVSVSARRRAARH